MQKTYSHGQFLSNPLLQTRRMKNRTNEMDAELRRKIEGLTVSQIRLMAAIYAGMANQLRKKKSADSLAKWKARKEYRRN